MNPWTAIGAAMLRAYRHGWRVRYWTADGGAVMGRPVPGQFWGRLHIRVDGAGLVRPW